MAFNLGQMRRNQYDAYTNDLDYRVESIINKDISATQFYDKCMKLSGDSVMSYLYSYYLKFEVTKLPSAAQDFTVKLRNESELIDNEQEVRYLTVKPGTDTTIFEIIFTPNATYDEIIFELTRTASDYNTDREMNVTVREFKRVNNVISGYLQTQYPDLSTLKKIGIQGPPGLMFVIDGEEIKIGRSGIYELYHEDINISYIGFVIKDSLYTQDGKDYFIMDFKY